MDDTITLSFKDGSNSSECVICLFGAHVLDFQINKAGPLLFLSKKAILDGTKPIRGGIPLVFPFFGAGDGSLPAHGFARISKWRVLLPPGGEGKNNAVTLVLEKRDVNSAYSDKWPHEFALEYTVVIRAYNVLETSLKIINLNQAEPFKFQALLHTYFSVPNYENILIDLDLKDPLEFYDQLTKAKIPFSGENCKLKIEKETDGICLNHSLKNNTVTLFYNTEEGDDASKKVKMMKQAMRQTRTFTVNGDSFPCDIVVWNPYIEKSKKMADFDDEEYKVMLCLEPGNVTPFKDWLLTPKSTAELKQVIEFSNL